MKNRRKVAAVLLVTFASLLVVLVFLLNTFVSKNRDRIREELEKSLGRSVKFDALRLSFWGGMALLAKRVSIAEDPRFAATPFMQAQELKMQLRWLPLLLGNIQINYVVLDGPEVQIIKNEQGTLNLSALAGSGKRTAEPRQETKEERETKRRAPLSLLPAAIYATKGRIDYIDRSFKEPVEIKIRNIRMDLKGLALSGSVKVKVSADLFEGQGQSMTVEGLIGPVHGEADWTQQPLDLHLRLASLLLPQLSRAVPFLRETLSPYLATTGPLMVEAKILGTAERPRISDLAVTGAAFGTAENNASLRGGLDFSSGNSWGEGQIQGKLVVDPTSLEYLKRIPLLRQALPSSLASDGPLRVTSELRGSFANPKAHVLIKAADSEIRYGNWLSKPKGVAAEIEMKVDRQKDRVVFNESSLTLYNLKLQFAGLLEEFPERRLTLQLRSNDIDLAGWEKLLLPLSSFTTVGALRWDLSLKKNLGLEERALDLRGSLSLDQAQAKDKKTGRGVEKISARLSFRGKEARIENGEGIWDSIPLSNLKGDLAWLPDGLGFRNLSFQALGGTFRANGSWETRSDDSRRFTLEPTIEAVDLKALLAQEAPNFKDQVEGQLSFKAKFWGEAKGGATLKDNIQGEGATQVRGGALKNFNLVERVLSRVTGLPGLPALITTRVAPRYSALFQRRDTLFDTLAATFTVKQGRIYSDDLALITPDYGIYGDGWIGLDKTIKWDAILVMSPQFTQELTKEHRNVRHLLDRQGRLAVPFRLDGTLPYVQAKPDLAALAESIQRGLVQKGAERALGGDKDGKRKEKRDWIQKGLEQLFGK